MKLSVVLVARENTVPDDLRAGASMYRQIVSAARGAGNDTHPGDAHDHDDTSPSPWNSSTCWGGEGREGGRERGRGREEGQC